MDNLKQIDQLLPVAPLSSRAVSWKCKTCGWWCTYSHAVDEHFAELTHKNANARSLKCCMGKLTPHSAVLTY
jgi:hypothetical protein